MVSVCTTLPGSKDSTGTLRIHILLLLCLLRPHGPPTQSFHKGICAPMFIAALFTIVTIRQQPKASSADDWIKKMWDICTTDYHSAIRKHEILPFATPWLDLESITLSELSQMEKEKNHVNSLYAGRKTESNKCKNKFTGTDNSTVVAKGEGWRGTECRG